MQCLRQRIRISEASDQRIGQDNPVELHTRIERRANDQVTHFSEAGRARMVDVSEKSGTHRVAVASGILRMQHETLARIRNGSIAKGDVLTVADVGAVMAAKRTAEIIPMCHTLALSGVEVIFSDIAEPDAWGHAGIKVVITASCVGADRGRDGSAVWRQRGAADHLRHVQGDRPRHAHREHPAGREARRQERGLVPRTSCEKIQMIKVLFFGPVAERVGASELQVQFNAGMRLQDLRAQLQAIYPAAFEIVCFAAVNGDHALDMSVIEDGPSEVVFMSKYSGG